MADGMNRRLRTNVAHALGFLRAGFTSPITHLRRDTMAPVTRLSLNKSGFCSRGAPPLKRLSLTETPHAEDPQLPRGLRPPPFTALPVSRLRTARRACNRSYGGPTFTEAQAGGRDPGSNTGRDEKQRAVAAQGRESV
ncbi:hypothetical protein MRX96_049040 [Rhipicephalus microplus]